MSINNGGPAFPSGPCGGSYTGEDGYTTHQFFGSSGMDLRDWFAGQALAGRMSAQTGNVRAEVVAKDAYKLADAMIHQRNESSP